MKTKVVIAILAAAVLSGAAYWFVMWNVKRSVQRADWHGLEGGAEASLGAVLTARESAQPGPGVIPYYQEHPDELETDKRYFQTWRSAFTIAISERDREQKVEGWTSSATSRSIPPSNRTDAWGHAFCVRSSPQRIVVISPGPEALASLECATLDIPETDLANMAQNRLNLHRSGALVLVLPVQRRTGD